MTPARDTHDLPSLEFRPVLSRGRGRVVAVSAAIACAAAGLASARLPLIDRLEGLTIDWRFALRGPEPPPVDIIVVEIDRRSHRALRVAGQPYELRAQLAEVVDHLAEAGALVVGIDIWLDGLTSPEADHRLADVLANSNVVLAAAYADEALQRAAPLFRATGPLEGVINVQPDHGVLRQFPAPLYLDVLADSGAPDDIERLPSFALALALFGIWEEDADAQIAFVPGRATIGAFSVGAGELVNFCAIAPREDDQDVGWRTLRFEDVARNRFDRDGVDGAIVLIGEAGTIQDAFAMPLAEGQAPGVFFHANGVAHILERRGFDARWTSPARRDALIFLLALAAGLFAWNPRSWWSHRRGSWLLGGYILTGIAVFPGGWLGLSAVGFDHRVVLPVAGPTIAMALALGAGLVFQWIVSSENARRLAERNREVEALFGQTVSDRVLAALKQDPARVLQTEVRDVSVLFCDLRGFTASTADMPPADVAAMLNEYFTFITEAVFEHDGFIDKFVGDEIMAVFSAPFEQPDHAERAVRTAIAIKRRVSDLNRLRQSRGEALLACGVGIHSGPAAAGPIGSSQRSNYTVVGRTVNLAARIEHCTQHGEILISQATRDLLDDGPDLGIRPWRSVALRGTQGAHALFEVDVSDAAR